MPGCQDVKSGRYAMLVGLGQRVPPAKRGTALSFSLDTDWWI